MIQCQNGIIDSGQSINRPLKPNKYGDIFNVNRWGKVQHYCTHFSNTNIFKSTLPFLLSDKVLGQNISAAGWFAA